MVRVATTLPDDWRERLRNLEDSCGAQAVADAMGVSVSQLNGIRSRNPIFAEAFRPKSSPPGARRVKVPDLDTSELINELRCWLLTLNDTSPNLSAEQRSQNLELRALIQATLIRLEKQRAEMRSLRSRLNEIQSAYHRRISGAQPAPHAPSR